MTGSKFSAPQSPDNGTATQGIDWAEIDENGSVLHFTSGKDGFGREYYAYVFMQPSKYRLFLEKSQTTQTINLHDYGLVIESGFGALPPVDVQEEMEKKYFFNHTYQDELLSAL